MTARRYTEQQRAEALELYVELGAPETARRLGIPKATVASWARRAGVHTDAADPARARARTEAARARWEEVSEERRQQLAGRLLEEVHRLGDQLQEPTVYHHVVTLSGGKDAPATSEVVEVHVSHPVARDQKDRAQAMAALMDKLQLLSGGATDRVEDIGLDLEAEAQQMHAEKLELAELRRLRDTGT